MLRVLMAIGAAIGSYGQVVELHEANRTSSGFVFYAPTALEKSFLLRNDGTIAHSWPGSGPSGLGVKLLADGTILRTLVVSSSTFAEGRGAGGGVEKRSWDGELLWSYRLPDAERYLQHHDVEGMPNGNVLIIAWEHHSREDALAAGRSAAKLPERGIWSEVVVEVKPEGPTGGAIVWQWRVWDHLVQDANPGAANFGEVAGNSRRIDLNFTGSNPNVTTNSDWLHFNSVSYNPALDQILLSSRPWSEIWVIDHSTTTAEAASTSGGRYKKGGDLLYRWGNPQAYRAGAAGDQMLFNQHDAHWVDADMPGGGNILVFNNGIGRGYSSADELIPPVDREGNYTLGANGRFGPVTPVWTFGETAGTGFITQTAGSAQRLRNGNTMLCLSNANRVVEVTPEKEIVWNLNLGAGEAGGYTFRANRYAADMPQLSGTGMDVAAPNLLHAASLRTAPFAPGVLATAAAEGLRGTETVSIADGTGTVRPVTVSAAGEDRITFQLPASLAVGPARMMMEFADGGKQSRDFRVDGAAPGLFAANGDGKGAGAIVALLIGPQGRSFHYAYALDPATGSYVPNPIPLAGDVYLSLYGSGLRGATVTIGGVPVPVLSSTALVEFAGLDQVNAGPIPAALAGRKLQPVVATVGGAASNVVTVSFQ